MAELVHMFKDALWFSNKRSVTIDNIVFKSCTQFTPSILILGSIIVAARQFFGQPITCDPGNMDLVSNDVLESYCWMYAHFEIPEDYNGPCSGSKSPGEPELQGPVYNSYYQWVPIYLIFLAVIFYLPRCLWLMMEGGIMKYFTKGVSSRFIEDPEEKRDKLVKFFRDYVYNRYNWYYFCGFFICEILNIGVVISALFITDSFLQNRFVRYGVDTWRYYHLPPEERKLQGLKDPMCRSFPRIASCNYHRFGNGGKQSNINALCILSLNVINDKVFLLIWWWFVILGCLGLTRLIYRTAQFSSSRLRFKLLQLRLYRYFRSTENNMKVRQYIYACSLGDWFVLYQLSKNINRPFFVEFLGNLSRDPPSAICLEPLQVSPEQEILNMTLRPTLTEYQSREDPGFESEDES